MDAHEQIVWDGEVAAAVLGKGEDFALLFLNGPLDDATTKNALDRGFSYCGVLGIIDGRCAVKCEPRPDAALTMMHAALAFAQQVAELLRPRGDSVEWLDALYCLLDTRNDTDS